MTSAEHASLQALARLHMVVVGDLMLDHYIWGDATRISPEAPVPVVSVFRDSYTLGGAANVALNLKGLGLQVDLCGMLGDDAAAGQLRGLLDANGIGHSLCHSVARLHTIRKTRVIVQKQQLCRIDREDPPAGYSLPNAASSAAFSAALQEANAVILSDYAKGCLGEETWADIRKITRQCNTFLALDPKPRGRLQFFEPDLITPNRSEALELAGIECGLHEPFPAEAVCKAIWERYRPQHLVITLGADGMLLSEEGHVLQAIPTVAQEVFDVSGAGDTVIATLTASLAAGATFETAAQLANAAAGVVVGKVGTVAITRSELEAALSDPEHTALAD